MVAKKNTEKEAGGLGIEPLDQYETHVKILGTTPLIYNSMSAKAQQTLFLGARKKTAAEKKEIKHNPEEEFVDSCYEDGINGAHLSFPSTGIKRGPSISMSFFPLISRDAPKIAIEPSITATIP